MGIADSIRLAEERLAGRSAPLTEAMRVVVTEALAAEPDEALLRDLVRLAVKARETKHRWSLRPLIGLVVRIVAGDPHLELAGEAPSPLRFQGVIAELRSDLETALAAPQVECSVDRASERRSELFRALVFGEGTAWSDLVAASRQVWSDPADRAAILTDASRPPLLRAAAALGFAAAEVEQGRPLPATAVDTFRSLVDQNERTWAEQWAPVGLFVELGDRGSAGIVSPWTALTAMRTEAGTRRAVALDRVLFALVEAFPDARHQRAAMAANLLTFAVRERTPPFLHVKRTTPTPMADAMVARSLLLSVADAVSPQQWNYDVHHALYELDLPKSWLTFRRWLGVEPPGSMELPLRVGDEALTVGIACERVLATHTLAADALVRALVTTLGPRDVLRIVCDGLGGFDYWLDDDDGDPFGADSQRARNELRLAILAALDPAEARPLLVERLEARLDNSQKIDSAVVVLAFARLERAAGRELPLRYDAIVSDHITSTLESERLQRALLAELPVDRRNALIVQSRRAAFVMGPDLTELLDDTGRAMLDDTPKEAPHGKLAKLADAMGSLMESVKEELG